VGFIGAPLSGKTTIATSVFSHFKRLGLATELVVEQARQYIAEKKVANLKKIVTLDDTDQDRIFTRQQTMERTMKKACDPLTIIISDSSLLNTLMYLSANLRESLEEVMFEEIVSGYDLLLYCTPVEELGHVQVDSNRIHSLKEIAILQVQSDRLLNKVKISEATTIRELVGDLDLRIKDASTYVLEKRHQMVVRS